MITMLKAKLHQAKITHSELNYEGSCAIDEELIEKAGFLVNEKIDIYNINNGERFSTYVIRAERGSKIISLNGAAARKAHVGDRVIICSYKLLTENDALQHEPMILCLDEMNNVKLLKHSIDVQCDG